MSAFIKSIPLADQVIRRNPLFYGRFRRLLARMERATLDERRQLSERLLEASRRSAERMPGYAEFQLSAPLTEQPILTKETLQERVGDFQSRSWVPAIRAATGGSTGVPLQLMRSFRSLAMEQAMIDHLAAKSGVDLRHSRVAVLRGDAIKDPNDEQPPYWHLASPNRLVFSSNHLNANHYRSFEQELQRFQPQVLLAYPSSLELLADLAGERGSPIRFALVITSSEPLRPGLRQRVRNCFGAALLDYYGMAERVCAAYSLEDGVYRFVFPYGLAELVPDAPERYRIIGTSFWNRSQPLRRYNTEDIAIITGAVSSLRLERITLGLDTFGGIEGRATDYLLLADGSRIYTLDRVPHGVLGAATVQLVQESLDSALLVVVPNGRFSDQTLDLVRHNFYAKAPRTINLRIEVRDSPYRLPNGKAPSFISNLARA